MGEYAEYMVLGYAAMALVFVGMIAWIYMRYRAAKREEMLVQQMAEEIEGDRVHSAVGAVESEAQPGQAAPGVSGMANPTSDRARTAPKET